MVFSAAKDFLLLATKKYKLDNHAISALACEKSRQVIAKNFPQYVELWKPTKFVKDKLYISAKNSAASSELFLKTNHLLELIWQEELPAKIKEINIVKR